MADEHRRSTLARIWRVYMASVEHEPITGEWGKPPKAESFLVLDV